MGDFTVTVRQKPMDFNRWQLGLGTVVVAVPEQISDGFERGAGVQEMHGVGVAQAMGPVERDRQATPFGPAIEDHRHGSRAKSTNRGTTAEEERATGDIGGACLPHILYQYLSHPVGQWQVQDVACLAPGNLEPPFAPMDVVQGQGSDL